MARERRPTSDFGTVVLHLALLAAFLVLLATGLRIASDDMEHAWLRALDAVLPSEHLFWRHMIAGVALIAVLGGYVAYVRSARLTPRLRLDRARLAALVRPGKARWSALNVVVTWVLMIGLGVEIITGSAVYLGASSAWMDVHWIAMWVCLGAIGAHVALHLAYGGIAQLTRIVRPARLVVAPPPPDLAELLAVEIARRADNTATPPSPPVPPPMPAPARAPVALRVVEPANGAMNPPHVADVEPSPLDQVIAATAALRAAAPDVEHEPPRPPARAARARLNAHPLATALAAMLVLSGLAYGAEVGTRQTLDVARVERAAAPSLDGDLSDPAWRTATPARILTQHGGDFGGSGQSEVEVRAVHDADYLYLAVTWTDPTRSLKHLPLMKHADGWRVLQRGHDQGDETEFHEDKLSVLLADPGLPLIGAAVHLAARPLADKPASSHGRGLHYTPSGIADVWQWRASSSGPFGIVENCRFGTPSEPTAAAATGRERYAGGFVCEEGRTEVTDNVAAFVDNEAKDARVVPRRLPRDVGAVAAAMGSTARASSLFSDAEAGRWWLRETDTQPYAEHRDRAIPVGTIIPNVVVREIAPTPASIRGVARWAAGRWTLELVRRLDTGSAHDVAVSTGALIWFAAFDHSETRHTRHLRPLHLEVH